MTVIVKRRLTVNGHIVNATVKPRSGTSKEDKTKQHDIFMAFSVFVTVIPDVEYFSSRFLRL